MVWRSSTPPLKRLLSPKPIPLSSSIPTLSPVLPPQFHTIPPHSETYTNLLVSCSKQAILIQPRNLFDETPHRTQSSHNCKTLHARIIKHGLRLSGKLGSALVVLYSESGNLGYAQKAFYRLEERDGPAWNSILSAHSRRGSPEEVVRVFVSMRTAGTPPDQFGLAIVLSACARTIDLRHGTRVHCDIIKTGYESNPFCEGSLIDMYAKCGCVTDAFSVFDAVYDPDKISWTTMIAGYVRICMFDEALQLFFRMQDSGCSPDQVTYVTVITACVGLGRLEDARAIFAQMPDPNAVAWNSIISGHAQIGREAEALVFFREMQSSGVKPTRSTLGSVLSAAANLTALDEGRQIHSAAIQLGLDSNVFVGSSLINMYAKCCCVEDALKAFGTSTETNTVTWNAMLGGHLQNGQPQEVIELFLEMKALKFPIDEFTFVSAFGACASMENLNIGRQLHCLVIKTNFVACLFIENALVDMYAKSGVLNDATRLFELIHNKDNVSWNAIIIGHAHNKEEEEALSMFRKMRSDAVVPDEVTFASVISACSSLQAFEEGKQIHCLSIKSNLGSNLYVGSSLIDLYSKLKDMDAAQLVYVHMPERSVVAWNALISGHVQNENEEEAFGLFRRMQAEGLEPSHVTFASILPASGVIIGRQLHCCILKSGLMYSDGFVGVSLLGMYLKSKKLKDANKLFSEMPECKSLVLWTAMISGHAQNDYGEDALQFFKKMRGCNVHPDQATFASVLRACADLAALKDGKVVHGLVIRTGFGSDEYTSSALMDMYSKCGDVGASLQVFEELEKKADAISWNSMIVGFAKNGYAEEALILFHQMQRSLIKPDNITFLGVLTACSHAGLVSEGRGFFDYMPKKYGITPRADHYACVIDLLGRGGYLKEAEEFIDRLPFEPDGVIFATLLGACRIHGDWERGKRAAEKVIELEPHNSSPYVLLSSIYAASGNWVGAKMVRKEMRERGVRKLPGCSWIVVGNKTSTFVAEDIFHPDAVDIYETLKDLAMLMKENGYVELDLLLLDEECSEE